MNQLLHIFRKNINDKEIRSLSLEGFNDPNDFSIAYLQETIKSEKFPKDDLKEYCFAIHETPFEEIEILQPHLRGYIYAIFLYAYFNENGCIDTLDEIYLYLFLKTALEVRIEKIFIKRFLKELKYNTKAPTHFLELARIIVLCDDTQCKEFKSHFLISFKNDGCTLYDDFYKRWMSFLSLCANQEVNKCTESTLSEALKEHNRWKKDSCCRFSYELDAGEDR